MSFAGGDPVNKTDPTGEETPCKNTTLASLQAAGAGAVEWGKGAFLGIMNFGGRGAVKLVDTLTFGLIPPVHRSEQESERQERRTASDIQVAIDHGEGPGHVIARAVDKRMKALDSASSSGCKEDIARVAAPALLDGYTALRATASAINTPAAPAPALATNTGSVIPAAVVITKPSLTPAVMLASAVNESQKTSNRGSNNQRTNSAARIGQEAHRQIEAKLRQLGYDTEVTMILADGTVVRKDAVRGEIAVIIKPDTVTGRAAAASRAALMKANGWQTEVILYNPGDLAYQPGSPTFIGPKSQ